MRIVDLPHVLAAIEGVEGRRRIFRIVTNLPLSPLAPGHNAEKLRRLQKAVERIAVTEPYRKYDQLELTNEAAPHAQRAR